MTFIEDATDAHKTLPETLRGDVTLELQLVQARLHAVKLVAWPVLQARSMTGEDTSDPDEVGSSL